MQSTHGPACRRGTGALLALTGVLVIGSAAPAQDVPPQIHLQPCDVSVMAGEKVRFECWALGTSPKTFSWRLNGEWNPSLSGIFFAPGIELNGARVDCVVSNSAGTVISREAILTVSSGPVLPTAYRQPVSQARLEGEIADFRINLIGGENVTYQWQRDRVDIPDSTGNAHRIMSPTLADDGAAFRCLISSDAGSFYSDEALLTVLASPEPPEILVQPQDVTVAAG
jgi:hypothetical protein